jgi:hypothetical protein
MGELAAAPRPAHVVGGVGGAVEAVLDVDEQRVVRLRQRRQEELAAAWRRVVIA